MRQRIGRNAFHRILFRNQFLADHIDGDANSGVASALAVARLQNVEAIFLHRELEVLHVFEMLLEDVAHLQQTLVRGRHFFREVGDRMRCAHARDHVFALRVDQIFAVENFFAASRIAREGDAGRARVAHVTENHRLDVDGRAPVMRDSVFPAVNNRAIVHPRTEDGSDRAPQLFVRLLRK